MSGDNYCGSASFVIDYFWADDDDQAQAAINVLRDELVDWINTKKKSNLPIRNVEVLLSPDEIEER